MFSMFFSVLLLWSCLSSTVAMTTAAPCEDIDTAACQLMIQSRPDLCNDATLAETACKRFCGKCPVRCVTCQAAVNDLSMCTDVEECDTDQDCYSMEIFDFDGTHRYNAGCMAKQYCVQDPSLLVGRSSSNVRTSCCDTDLCNQVSTTVPTTTTTRRTTTTHHVTKATTTTHHHSPHCNDILGTGYCATDHCIHANLCRRTCGLCCKCKSVTRD